MSTIGKNTRAKCSVSCCVRYLLRLRFGYERDHTVEHAIAHCNRDVDDVRSLTIHAARKHRVAGRLLHRHTLAGERCLIHAGPAFMRCSV